MKLYQMLITVTPSPNWQNIHPLGEPDPDLCNKLITAFLMDSYLRTRLGLLALDEYASEDQEDHDGQDNHHRSGVPAMIPLWRRLDTNF